MMKGTLLPDLPSASGSSANGALSLKTMVRSSPAERLSVAAISAWPKLSRLPQRSMLATQSRASTGVPSWNFSPSRSAIFQVLPSSSVTAPAAICGETAYFAFWP